MPTKKNKPRPAKRGAELNLTSGLDADIRHLQKALGRVKAPFVRYVIVLAVDLVTERLQQLESAGEFLVPAAEAPR